MPLWLLDATTDLSAHALLRPKGASRLPLRTTPRSLGKHVEALVAGGFEPRAMPNTGQADPA